jgi:hypothetical protein
VINQYNKDSKELVLKACNTPGYLQEVSGIAEDLQTTENDAQEIICFDEDDFA